MQYEFTNMQPVAQNKLKTRNQLQMLTSDLFVYLTQSTTDLIFISNHNSYVG